MECETMPVPQLSQISSALGRVDLDLIIPKFYVPLGRQLGEPVQIALLHLRVQPSLVKRVEVMADVPELGAVEDLVVLLAVGEAPTKPQTNSLMTMMDGKILSCRRLRG